MMRNPSNSGRGKTVCSVEFSDIRILRRETRAAAHSVLDHGCWSGTVPAMRKALAPRPTTLLRSVLLVCCLLLLMSGCGRSATEGVYSEDGYSDVVYREDAFPADLTLDLEVPVSAAQVSVVDNLNGATIPLRYAELTDRGLRVGVPRLPVGKFTVDLGATDVVLRIEPRAGKPIEVQTPTKTFGAPYLVMAGAAALGLLLVTLRRKHGLVPVLVGGSMLVLALGGGALLGIAGSGDATPSWERCEISYPSADKQTFEKRDCKVRVLVGMLEDGRLEDIQALLTATNIVDCHEVAHLAGFYWYREQRSLQAARDALILGCNDGLIHGVLESMGVYTDEDALVRNIHTLCGSVAYEPLRRTCDHGAGHAAFWRTNGDLEEAWTICNKRPATPVETVDLHFNRIPSQSHVYTAVAQCRGAAVMEWADRWELSRQQSETPQVIPALDEPMDICLGPYSVDEEFEAGCYLATNYRSVKPQKAIDRCNNQAHWVRSCFGLIGDSFTPFSARLTGSATYTIEGLRNHAEMCGQARDSGAEATCMETLAAAALVRAKLPVDAVRSLCANSSGESQVACRRGIELGSSVIADLSSP